MKKVLLASVVVAGVAACAADDAAAMDIGWGLSLNNEVTTEYNVDTEHFDVTWGPEVAYTIPMAPTVELTAGADVKVYNTTDDFALADTFEEGSRPDLDLGVSMDLSDNLEVYGKTSWDLNESEMGDIVVGATFSF